MAPTSIDDLCSRVDGSKLMANLGEFSKRVKLSGTAEELESFRFLETTLGSYGYRTTLIQHDAYISLPGKARVDIEGTQPACITHSFSRPSEQGGTRGRLLFVGSGTDEDFAKADVRGQIALIEGLATPAVSLRASRAGALGQLHVSPHEHLHEMCISPVWGSPAPEDLSLLPRTVVLSIPKSAGAPLQQRLARGEVIEVTLYAEVDTGWRKTPILVAELEAPANFDDSFVMFSGHHDTWYYGVMDNGGANATMLEVARIAASERGYWRRGLRLCFWSGHSHGRYSGSAWYADQFWNELRLRCVAHVNVDSTGAKGNTVLADMPASAELLGVGREAVKVQGCQDLTGFRMSRAGDQSFWGIGIPSLFMTVGEQPAGSGENVAGFLFTGSGRKGAGFGWWWHTPDDTLDKMDPEILVRDTRVYVHAIWRLLTDPVVPLDYVAYADALAAELRALEGDLTGRIDLSSLTALAGELRKRAEILAERTAGSPENAPSLNRTLMGLSRYLVPIDYVASDAYQPDPALGQPPYPVLEPRALARTRPGSDEEKFQLVSAVRARNRVADAVERATSLLETSPSQ